MSKYNVGDKVAIIPIRETGVVSRISSDALGHPFVEVTKDADGEVDMCRETALAHWVDMAIPSHFVYIVYKEDFGDKNVAALFATQELAEKFIAKHPECFGVDCLLVHQVVK